MSKNKSKSDQNKKTDVLSDEDKKLIHDHAWNHFQFVAKQRVDFLKYYIVFISAYFTSVAAITVTMYSSPKLVVIGTLIFPLVIVFLIITYIFKCLEIRNKELVENSLKSLKMFEKEVFNDKNVTFCIFLEDKEKAFLSHSQCYNLIFHLGYAISVVVLMSFFIF